MTIRRTSRLTRLALVSAVQFPLLLAGLSAIAATTVPGGNVSGTWTAAGSPYLVQGDIAVPIDSTLTIEPGVEVSFQGWYGLTVNGYLQAQGAEADSIRFTASSSWGGVTFTNPSVVSHVVYTSFSDSVTGFLPSVLTCDNSSPDISHCRISGGGTSGAAIRARNSGNPRLAHSTICNNALGIWWDSYVSGTISDCVIASNGGSGGAPGEGGVMVLSSCNLTFIDCLFSDNTHTGSRGGGAVCIWMPANLTFSGCTFSSNECTSFDGPGGAVYARDGAQAIFTDCTLIGNTCNYTAGFQGGGAISLYSGASAILTRCTLFENIGAAAGGAIAATQSSSFTLDRCTVDHNGVYGGPGGILYADGGSPVMVKNCIISNSYGYPAQGVNALGALTLHHSAFFNNECGDITGTIPAGFGELVQENANGDSCDAYYNIFMDPLYVNQPAGDHHLTAESPCIDAGDPASPPDPDGTVADMGRFYFNQLSSVAGPAGGRNPDLGLGSASPNPFSGRTTMSYTLARVAPVRADVFDVQGRRVATLWNGPARPGTHPLTWDGREEGGQRVAPGMYMVRIGALGRTATDKFVLLR